MRYKQTPVRPADGHQICTSRTKVPRTMLSSHTLPAVGIVHGQKLPVPSRLQSRWLHTFWLPQLSFDCYRRIKRLSDPAR